MDKSAIKTYAVEARRKLIDAVRQKAHQLYIYEDGALPPDKANHRLRADGIFLTSEQSSARLRLCNDLAALGHTMDNRAAFQHVIENIACTWFNRLIALRIMEVNDWLPSNVRILSSREPGRAEPDAMREVERLDYVDQSKIAELRADTGMNAAEKLYRYILIAQCNALSAILPGMFEKENDYTELLLPDAPLSKGGIINDLVTQIDENNFNIKEQGQIEIIGWLYQFYISEKKDEVNAKKKSVAISKDTIPAVTQLFTPEWIVRYMVENSLGRLWLAHCPPGMAHGNAEDTLRRLWTYYIEEAEQDGDVEKRLKELADTFTFKDPTQIKLIDPCMGSGHILVYAFDVFYQIYQSMGYSEREIPSLILQNNLYGLDVDDRSGQLAYFALMMKARSYNRRFFRQENIPQPMVFAVPEATLYIYGLEKWLGVNMREEDRKACFEDLIYLAELFGMGKDLGSLIRIERKIDFMRLRGYIHDFAQGQITLEDTELIEQAKNLGRLVDVAAILSEKYDVVVTNPPYMAPAPSQADWVRKNYPNSKSDLCVVFIERNLDLLKQNCYLSMITMHSWMFLSSYERLRKKLIGSKDIVSMAHLGARAFEEIGGEVVQTTAFVMRSSNVPGYLGTYARLVEYNSQQAKEDAFLAGGNRHAAKKGNFEKIPGWPVAYWVGDNALKAFDNGTPLGTMEQVRGGLTTGDNNRFLRLWFEVNCKTISFGASSIEETETSDFTWYPISKGGEFRKWYGNMEYIVNWKSNGSEIKYWVTHNPRDPNTTHWSRRLFNIECYFKRVITWSGISSGIPSMRIADKAIFGSGAKALLPSDKYEYYLAFLNSNVALNYLQAISPTLNYESGHIASLPILGRVLKP